MPKAIAFRPTESLELNLFNEVSESGKDISKVIKKRLEDLIFLKHLFEEGIKIKVLVVDDSDDIREVLDVYFDTNRIEHKSINNGMEGLEAIRNNQYDLVLLDIAMPAFSGMDVMNSLQKDGLLQSRNIVIFTASSDPRVMTELRRRGANDIFKKPCSLEQLGVLIEKYSPK